MGWGSVTITYIHTGYTQNYKRNHVDSHEKCAAMVAAAVADSVARINVPGANVSRNNIAQKINADPGPNYRVI